MVVHHSVSDSYQTHIRCYFLFEGIGSSVSISLKLRSKMLPIKIRNPSYSRRSPWSFFRNLIRTLTLIIFLIGVQTSFLA